MPAVNQRNIIVQEWIANGLAIILVAISGYNALDYLNDTHRENFPPVISFKADRRDSGQCTRCPPYVSNEHLDLKIFADWPWPWLWTKPSGAS